MSVLFPLGTQVMKREVSIVMYHYVRDLQRSRYPRIKGLDLAEFSGQLDYVRRNYQVVTVAEVVHAIRSGDELPAKALLLTFDDGYIDHYTAVFPILFDAGLEGAFFPSVAPACRDELLDVNRIQFVLAVADPAELVRQIDEAVVDHRKAYNLGTPEFYREKWAVASRFDSAKVIYIKRMLQVGLPEELRADITRLLFARHVSIDETAFARELYATEEQLRVMQASGMYVGTQGDSHYWLNAVPTDVQRREIAKSLEFLRRIGSPVDDYWVMCYPYGAWNESLIDILDENECAVGLTTEVGTADLDTHPRLKFPRWDTNDLPKSV